MRQLLSTLFALACLLPQAAAAASLQVAPVTVDLNANRRAATMTIINGDSDPVAVQVRVFRWTRVNGQEVLEPTRDVVASPPAAKLAPGASQLIRVLRVTDRPASKEEGYRVLVDELPNPQKRKAGEISLVLRHSIPIFFSSRAGNPQVSWRIERTAAGHELVAVNTGARRLRLADLQLKTRKGELVHSQGGLAGYVLAGAEMRWNLKLTPENAGNSLALSAASDLGAVNATLDPPT